MNTPPSDPNKGGLLYGLLFSLLICTLLLYRPTIVVTDTGVSALHPAYPPEAPVVVSQTFPLNCEYLPCGYTKALYEGTWELTEGIPKYTQRSMQLYL